MGLPKGYKFKQPSSKKGHHYKQVFTDSIYLNQSQVKQFQLQFNKLLIDDNPTAHQLISNYKNSLIFIDWLCMQVMPFEKYQHYQPILHQLNWLLTQINKNHPGS